MNNQFFTPHFSLLELTVSRTTRKHNMANVPGPEEVAKLSRL